jgi:hypothetical protein
MDLRVAVSPDPPASEGIVGVTAPFGRRCILRRDATESPTT